MNKIIYLLGLIMLGIISLSSCKKEKISVVNKDFSIEIKQPQGATTPKVGEPITLQLNIKGFDVENNKGDIETFFYVRNAQGVSTGQYSTTDKKEIPLGESYKYDYRRHKMSLDFLYTPTQDGDQDLYVEVKCQGVTKSSLLHIGLKTKSVIVTATGGGKIQHDGKKETSFSLMLKYGETASFKAIPEPKNKFVGWYLGDKELSNSLDYVLRAEKDVRIEARFKPMSYHVKPSINIKEAGTVETTTGREVFEDGDLVEVRVTPNEKHKDGYIFKGWYVGGKLVGDRLTYAFNAKDDVAPEARFEAKVYSFRYNQKNESRYTILLDGKDALQQSIKYGQTYTISLKAHVFNNNDTDERITFLFKNLPSVERKIESYSFDTPSKGEEGVTLSVICRGDVHLRVQLHTEREVGPHRITVSRDEYID